MENQSNLNMDVDEIKKQLNYYSKQKDDLTADIFRIEGILMFLQNELKKMKNSSFCLFQFSYMKIVWWKIDPVEYAPAQTQMAMQKKLCLFMLHSPKIPC